MLKINIKNNKTNPTGNKEGKVNILLIAVILSIIIAILAIACVNSIYKKVKDQLPSVSQLENIEPSLITRIYSADDTLLKEFYTERRIWRTFDQIPPVVYNAVISIEDKRFWHHWGMNIYTLPDIAVKTILFRKNMRGGSTLTQQLARNLYTTIGHERSLGRKIKELFTAFQIEKTYTKKDILVFYLNQVCMGGGAYGFQAAAQKYFGKDDLRDLTIGEAASLAAIIQRPEYYRPDNHPENLVKRRNLVLLSMHRDGFISGKDYTKAVAEQLNIIRTPEKAGKAPYFVETIRQYLEREYGANILYTGGLTVKTTLNYKCQRKAEALSQAWLDTLQVSLDNKFIYELQLVKRFKAPRDSIKAHIEEYAARVDTLFENVYSETETEVDSSGQTVKKLLRKALPDSMHYRKMQIAFAMIDNNTGCIQMLIGGRNFEDSKFNRVTQAYRQPGSAFKPFIYTAAIDNGYTPAYTMLDQAFSIKDPVQGEWRPENYDREFRGLITLRKALALSINTIAIKLQQKVGTNTVINYAVNMGLSPSHLPPVPSLAIGSCDATPLAMISAYSAFPSHGVRIEPFSIDMIYNRDMSVLNSHHTIHHNVLNPRTAYIMTSMLRSVVLSGTAYGAYLQGITWPAAGKTGTTNDYTDAWFIGFTANQTCGLWTGIDEKRSLGNGRTGANSALPVWTAFMMYLHDSLRVPAPEFDMPDGIITKKICKVSYMLAGEKCDSTYDEVFAIGTEPDLCTQDHDVKRAFKENKIDPFGTRSRKEQSPQDSTTGKKKKQNIYLM